MRKTYALLALLMIALLISGCSINKKVEEFEVGLFLNEGTRIQRELPAGRHTAWGFFDKIETVSVSAISVEWGDPELVTKDKQPVGLSVWVTFRRAKAKVPEMWREYNHEAINDEALRAQVIGRVPRVAKAVTTQFTLDQMLGVDEEGNVNEELGRYVVQQKMHDLLAGELEEIYCDLLDIGINNIAPDPTYIELLTAKASAQVGVEVAKAKTIEKAELLLQEQAQTKIALEIAERERRVAQERAKVYETNPGWLRLQIWEAAKQVFAGDTVWFIDPNADITLLFGTEGAIPIER